MPANSGRKAVISYHAILLGIFITQNMVITLHILHATPPKKARTDSGEA